MEFSKEIKIGNHIISEKSPVFIIAEVGVNHNGDMKLAKRMIDVAVEAGVDAVKFQAFKSEELVLRNVGKAFYQKVATGNKGTQYEMLKQLELTKKQIMDLMEYCAEKGILFLATPFEKKSLDELDDLEVPAFKVASTDITNIQFLRQIAEKKKPMVISAGMCYMEEVRRALEAVCPINGDVILLQCTANYPIHNSEANINVIKTFRETFNILAGYSDHSQGVGASPYAVAVGAKVIEKHFTLDKNLQGPDHKASVTPEELRQLVEEIRRVEDYLGDGMKIPTYSEQMTRKSLQKCLVAQTVINSGDVFTEENIVAKRTSGVGISALYYNDIVGKTADRCYDRDDIIQ